jgi:NAD-dependent DNA ligase
MYKVKLFHVANDMQLLLLVNSIIKDLIKNETILFFGEEKVIQKRLSPLVKVLMLIKGISIHIATLIENKYSNLKDVKDVCRSNSINIKGIGQKRQENIFKFLSKIL